MTRLFVTTAASALLFATAASAQTEAPANDPVINNQIECPAGSTAENCLIEQGRSSVNNPDAGAAQRPEGLPADDPANATPRSQGDGSSGPNSEGSVGGSSSN